MGTLKREDRNELRKTQSSFEILLSTRNYQKGELRDPKQILFYLSVTCDFSNFEALVIHGSPEKTVCMS